ncbi:GntR family transcriptional regulator [Microbacterium murale]|uniref:DNA-binding GntR family transcriptional regulator n=1 Tax=Microbacterium murale TaxID=1081040 RepID=A0ABU0PE48_9MICO|nr:GntR family transcriptional regulator [Microbacterium murale]MDQ0644966.1 DNA-binding GntR family transcriptional regulator [Microbacterium murale]
MSRAALATLRPLVERDHLAERTYQVIRAAVLSGDLPPGTPLSVPELARRLEVSRSPVREAVQRIIHDQLATHVLHSGAVVSRVDGEDLRSLYVVRELLEGLAARLATEAADQPGLDALSDLLTEHERLFDEGARDDDDASDGGPSEEAGQRHIELDTRFHRAIRDLAGNHHLSDILDSIVDRSHSAMHTLWGGEAPARLALEEHRRIVEAMLSGDPAAAEEAARDHVVKLGIRLRRTPTQ